MAHKLIVKHKKVASKAQKLAKIAKKLAEEAAELAALSAPVETDYDNLNISKATFEKKYPK